MKCKTCFYYHISIIIIYYLRDDGHTHIATIIGMVLEMGGWVGVAKSCKIPVTYHSYNSCKTSLFI